MATAIVTLQEGASSSNLALLKAFKKDSAKLASWIRQGISVLCEMPGAMQGDPVKDFSSDVLKTYKVSGP